MSKWTLKAIFPVIFLACILLILFIEVKDTFQQIKKEAEDARFTETDGGKPQDDKSYSVALWKAVERRDSYNNELQFYSRDNVVIEGDTIEITSNKEKCENKMYTSGLAESTYAYKYGYFEFTIEISEGKGIFPAIWFMPLDGDTLPEIDLFEMIGSEPYTFYGVIHFMKDEIQASDYFTHNVSIKDMYVVALEWTEGSLTWYIDELEVYSTALGVPHEYMYIIINQAIGGDWPGSPDDDTVFPNRFRVRSVRLEPVFKKGRG